MYVKCFGGHTPQTIPPTPCRPSYSTVSFKNLCKCQGRPADFRAHEWVETICKSVLWLSWLPHALLSSPNLGKRRFGLAVRHTAQSRSKTVLYDEYRTGGAFGLPTQRTINSIIVVWLCGKFGQLLTCTFTLFCVCMSHMYVVQ